MNAKTLALYLGCEAICKWMGGDEKCKLIGISEGKALVDNGFRKDYIPPSLVKPLLRPLPSMTEEEAVECGFGIVPLSLSLFHTTWTPLQFQWLLSKGFDLFGLIEKGEAIDSTTLTPTP